MIICHKINLEAHVCHTIFIQQSSNPSGGKWVFSDGRVAGWSGGRGGGDGGNSFFRRGWNVLGVIYFLVGFSSAKVLAIIFFMQVKMNLVCGTF